MNTKRLLASCLAFFIFIAGPLSTAWCRVVIKGAPIKVRTTLPGMHAPAINMNLNPALRGGISLSGSLTPTLKGSNISLHTLNMAAPAAAVQAALTLPVAAQLSPAAVAISGLGTPKTFAPVPGRNILNAVGDFADGIRNAAKKPFAAAASSALLFDGRMKAADDDGSPVDASGASFKGRPGRSQLEQLAEENNPLTHLYPRTVFILDSFPKEAPDTTVELIETLLQNNVRVVFITPRAARGDNSADSVLVSRIKPRTGNPLIVASYNGANITARSSRADIPTPLVDDLPGFAESTIDTFRAINAKLRKKFAFRGNLEEFGLPETEGALIYGAELPNKTADIKAFAAAYNKALQAAQLPHRVETGVNANGRPYFFIQSSELSVNSGRVLNALYARFPDLRDSLQPSEILVLGDLKKAGAFVKALPGKGHHLYNASDEASMHDALASVLGSKSYEQVRITRSKIRAFISWENRKNRTYKPRGGGGGGSAANASKKKTGSMHRMLGFYRGIIVYNLMPKLYRIIRKGQYDQATLEAATDLLQRMWYNPMSEWVRINDELEAARHSPIWKAMEKGYLESTRIWLANYYRRNFANYPRNLGEEVIGKLINTHMDIGNGISLGFTSPFTNNRYIVKVLPNRVFLEYDDEGPVLIAHVDRSGKEPYQQEFDESMETNMVARATLKGYGELRKDGLWYVNDEANPRVKVVYHYNTRDLSHTYSPQELEANAAEVTALIDRMQADAEFLADFEEQRKKNETMTNAAKKRKKEQADARKHKLTKDRRAKARLRKAERAKGGK